MGESIKFPVLLRVVGETAPMAGFSASRHVAEIRDRAQGDLEQLLGSARLAELLSLGEETDAELFFSGLMKFAGKMEQLESTRPLASSLYRRIEDHSAHPSLIQMAGERRAALEGGGDFGDRAESIFRQIGQQSGDYRTWLGMFAGAAIGSGLYNLVRHRTGRSLLQALHMKYGGANFHPIEIVAMRFKARTTGWLVGSAAAALSERSLRQTLGQPVSWEASALGRDMAIASLNLFAWRSAVALSDAYSLRAIANAGKSNPILKQLEIFAFQKTLAAASLGGAMLLEQKLFDQYPQSGIDAGTRIASLVVGMSLGRLMGRTLLLARN